MQKERDKQIKLKTILVGDHRVGKTSIVRRQVDNIFEESWKFKPGYDVRFKKYMVGDVKVINYYWDTSNQQCFKTVNEPFFKGADIVLFCFDLANHKSFQNCQFWMKEIEKYNRSGVVYLIGCRSDLQHKVYEQEIRLFADKYQMRYFQLSAKESVNVSQTIRIVVEKATEVKMAAQQTVKIGQKNNFIKKKSNCN